MRPLALTAAGLVAAVLGTAAGVYFNRGEPAAVKPPELAAASASILMATARLIDAEGKAQSLEQWRGRTLVINFWATWCAPCLEEIPELSRLQTQYADKGVQFVGIAVDSAANVAQFSKTHNVSYPLLVGEASAIELSRQFGNQALALPYTVVVGEDGKTRLTKLGRISAPELVPLLQPQPARH